MGSDESLFDIENKPLEVFAFWVVYVYRMVGRLVELVESGRADSPEMDALMDNLLGPYRGQLDAVVLGCTHYPFAAAAISRVLGEKTLLLDGGEGTARETQRRLAAAGLLSEGPGELVIRNSLPGREIIDLCYTLLKQGSEA